MFVSVGVFVYLGVCGGACLYLFLWVCLFFLVCGFVLMCLYLIFFLLDVGLRERDEIEVYQEKMMELYSLAVCLGPVSLTPCAKLLFSNCLLCISSFNALTR